MRYTVQLGINVEPRELVGLVLFKPVGPVDQIIAFRKRNILWNEFTSTIRIAWTLALLIMCYTKARESRPHGSPGSCIWCSFVSS